MTTDMHRIELGKQRLRQKLAQLPIADKLRLLERLREEELPKYREKGASNEPSKSGSD